MQIPDIEKSYQYEKKTTQICKEYIEEFYFDNIELNNNYYKKWDEQRYNYWINKLKTKNCIFPVKLELINGIYSVDDGNHRCHVCNELGYTHIPAEIRKITKKK